MARLDFSEYYKPKTNKAPSTRYYDPPKPPAPKPERKSIWEQKYGNYENITMPNQDKLPPNYLSKLADWFGNIGTDVPGWSPMLTDAPLPPDTRVNPFPVPTINSPVGSVWDRKYGDYEGQIAGLPPKPAAKDNNRAYTVPYIDPYGNLRQTVVQSGRPSFTPPISGISSPWASTVAPDKFFQLPSITGVWNDEHPYPIPAAKPGNKPWASNGASVPAISYVNRLQGAWNGAYLFPDIKSGYSTVNPNANMNLPMLNPRITGVWNDEHPYPNQQAGYSTQTPTYPFPIVNPEPYGDLFDNVTYEYPGGGGGGGGWGGWGGWGGGGGSTSYGASSGVNSYLPGTRAGYGANASSPRYTGGGSGRASGYAGGQYGNQASWRMPMLVWNI